MATLQSLLTATQRLLHDANFKYWSQQALTDAINIAQKRVVGDSACNRSLQQIYLSGGLELYGYGQVSGAQVISGGTGYTSAPIVTFGASQTGGTTATGTTAITNGSVTQVNVTNGGSGYTAAPIASIAPPTIGAGATCAPTVVNINTLDVMNITVLWGTQRYILGRKAFTDFQATVRSLQNWNQYPILCASYGQTQWYLGPIPDQPYYSEWDTIINPSDLVNLTDTSVVGYPYSECIPYYAAHTAKYQEQSYNEAAQFLQIYTQKMSYSRRSVMMRMIPTPYG